MSLNDTQIKAILAIIAGVMTNFKIEAWIGPGWPPTKVLRGPAASLIGAVAILLGVWLLYVSS